MYQRTLLITLFCVHIIAEPSDSPRTLVISNGGIIKLIVGLTMPVELPVSLIWLQNLQYQYAMIDRASQLSYLHLLRKSANRAITRNVAYHVLADYWSRPHETSLKMYKDAMEIGRKNGKCSDRYSFCKNNFLNYFIR